MDIEKLWINNLLGVSSVPWESYNLNICNFVLRLVKSVVFLKFKLLIRLSCLPEMYRIQSFRCGNSQFYASNYYIMCIIFSPDHYHVVYTLLQTHLPLSRKHEFQWSFVCSAIAKCKLLIHQSNLVLTRNLMLLLPLLLLKVRGI